MTTMTYTDRQRREIDYHRERAREHADMLVRPFDYDAIEGKRRRWWNAYWEMCRYLSEQDLAGKRVLVIGCGFGEDALRLARLGADVYAFDLSRESLELARALAGRERWHIHFDEMPAEAMAYPSGFFDVIVARDILHHVDIAATMGEVRRVAKSGALVVIDEVYSHSWTDKVRHCGLVEKRLYPALQRFVYAGEPYITEDERKLSEDDMARITAHLDILSQRWFNCVVGRLLPEIYDLACKVDRLGMMVAGKLGRYLANRVLVTGRING